MTRWMSKAGDGRRSTPQSISCTRMTSRRGARSFRVLSHLAPGLICLTSLRCDSISFGYIHHLPRMILYAFDSRGPKGFGVIWPTFVPSRPCIANLNDSFLCEQPATWSLHVCCACFEGATLQTLRGEQAKAPQLFLSHLQSLQLNCSLSHLWASSMLLNPARAARCVSPPSQGCSALLN